MSNLNEMSDETKKDFCEDVRSIISTQGNKDGLFVSNIPTYLRYPKFLGGSESGRVWKNLPNIADIESFLEEQGFTIRKFGKRTYKITV